MENAACEKWIRDHWWRIAGFAWREYQQHGRGAVNIWVDDEADTDLLGQLVYLSRPMLRPKGDKLISRLLKQVRAYQPDREVVIAFCAKSNGDGVYVMRGYQDDYSPKQAYLDHQTEFPVTR